MTIHLLRMAAGVPDLATLQRYVEADTHHDPKLGRVTSFVTRNTPRRTPDLLEGGSVYSIMKGMIQCRRRILDIRAVRDSQGSAACEVILDPVLIRVMPTPHRAMQGWRYLEPEKAPRDLGVFHGNEEEPPEDMAQALKAMGLL